MDGLRVQNTYVRILSIGCLAWSAWVGGRNCKSFPAATAPPLHNRRYTTAATRHHCRYTTATSQLPLHLCCYNTACTLQTTHARK
jgi:hypothetical protein